MKNTNNLIEVGQLNMVIGSTINFSYLDINVNVYIKEIKPLVKRPGFLQVTLGTTAQNKVLITWMGKRKGILDGVALESELQKMNNHKYANVTSLLRSDCDIDNGKYSQLKFAAADGFRIILSVIEDFQNGVTIKIEASEGIEFSAKTKRGNPIEKLEDGGFEVNGNC